MPSSEKGTVLLKKRLLFLIFSLSGQAVLKGCKNPPPPPLGLPENNTSLFAGIFIFSNLSVLRNHGRRRSFFALFFRRISHGLPGFIKSKIFAPTEFWNKLILLNHVFNLAVPNS
jgi:hypothetical protein